MRSSVGSFADRLWHEKEIAAAGPFETNAAAEQVYLAIQKLAPKDDLQRALQSRAAQLSNDLAQTRLLLFVESDNLVPAPFLAILAFWLVIIFASLSLFSPLNVTVFTCLSLFALSAACAIFLILELSQPFTGLLMISSAPLRNALGSIGNIALVGARGGPAARFGRKHGEYRGGGLVIMQCASGAAAKQGFWKCRN